MELEKITANKFKIGDIFHLDWIFGEWYEKLILFLIIAWAGYSFARLFI